MFSLSHLVLVDLLLQDLIGVGVNLHLLLFLQLASQPGQILLEGVRRKGCLRKTSHEVFQLQEDFVGVWRECGVIFPQHSNTTYLCSFQVAALPLPGGAVLGHGDLDLLKLGLRVLQLHLQVLCQLGSLHRLQQERNRSQSIKKTKKHVMMIFLSCGPVSLNKQTLFFVLQL